MISHVWSFSAVLKPPFPLISGNGGTETFVLGQCRELTRRGIENQIITFGLEKKDGRKFASDLNFVDFPSPESVETLGGAVLLNTDPVKISTTQAPFIILHILPKPELSKESYRQAYKHHRLITNSLFSRKVWSDYLGIDENEIGLVYPFSETIFGSEPVPAHFKHPTRVLFAGRLGVEKGVYTFLEALHFFEGDEAFEFSVVLAGSQDPGYEIIEPLIRAHPMIKAIPLRRGGEEMAKLLVQQDIVVMPGHGLRWQEPFGILSVEAQHAGCRVVGGDLGGLPETDCGGLHLFDADNPFALAQELRKVGKLGRLSTQQRAKATKLLTVQKSVDQLLAVLGSDLPAYKP